MTTQLVSTSQNKISFSTDQLDLIKRQIAVNATNDELSLFVGHCQRLGLDPFAKQIYFIKYNTKNGPKVSMPVSIDGTRLQAERTGKYAGSDEPVFEFGHGNRPVKASVTVYKIVGAQRCPFTASAYWDEYGSDRDMWAKMPKTMLAKCAENLALRKAFPAELSNCYLPEEMDQTIEHEPVIEQATPAPKTKKPEKKAEPPTSEIYTGTTDQQDKIKKILTKNNIPEEQWEAVHEKMIGKPGSALTEVMHEVANAGIFS